MAQTSTYDNVPVYTGQHLPQESAGFFQPPVAAQEGLIASVQARAVAEVQAALVIAASRPRNELRARDRLLQACQRVNLAAGALYQYSRGGTAISGPSIRLAEAAARAWGNMTYGFRELSRRVGESECEAYAWDLETNTKAVRQFAVRHRRDTKKGGYDLTDERDIYELMANQAQRRVRAAILEIIPGDIIEDAVSECEKTQINSVCKDKNGNVINIAEAAENLLSAFKAIGVSREAVEKRLGHRIDAIQPAQIIAFRKIYTSIKDGMSEPKDWFELEAKTETPKEQPAPEQPREEKPAAQKRRAPTKPQAGQEQPPAQQPEAKADPKAEQQQAPFPQGEPQNFPDDDAGDDPFPPSAMTVPCPNKNGQPVDELNCVTCHSRSGCPSWE